MKARDIDTNTTPIRVSLSCGPLVRCSATRFGRTTLAPQTATVDVLIQKGRFEPQDALEQKIEVTRLTLE